MLTYILVYEGNLKTKSLVSILMREKNRNGMILDKMETEDNRGDAGGQNLVRIHYNTYLQYKKKCW